MLAPRPPIFVGRRRAVAEMIVVHRQAAPIAVGHVFVVPAAPGAATPPRGDDDNPPLSQSGHDTPV